MDKKLIKIILIILFIVIISIIALVNTAVFLSDLEVKSLKQDLKTSLKSNKELLIDNQKIESLPLAVQRYAKFALKDKKVFSKDIITWDEEGVFHLPKLGRFQMKANQISKVDEPYYLWRGYMSKNMGLLKIESRDLFALDHHDMRAKIWGIKTVMHSNYKQKEDIKSLHTYLLLRYYATALNFPWVLFSDKHISWEKIDNDHAYLVVKKDDLIGKYIVSFAPNGQITKMETPDYNLHGNFEKLKEIAYKSKYIKHNGVMVPTHMKYIWLDKAGNKTTYEFSIKNIQKIDKE